MAVSDRWEKKVTWIPDLEGGLRTRWRNAMRDCRIEERAIADGRNNVPGQSSAELTSCEREVSGIYAQGAGHLRDWFRSKCAGAAEGIRARKIQPGRLRSLIGEGRARVFSIVASHKEEILTVCERADQRRRDLNAFRARHRLSRTHAVPRIDRRILNAGLLFFAIALETAMNSTFFAKGVGLIQGALYAFTVSAINVLLGVVCGLIGVRLLSNRYWAPKLVGLFVVLSTSAMAVFANFLYAHAREVGIASETGGVDPSAAMLRLMAQPFDLGNSLYLLAVGLIVYAFGVIEGRTGFTDAYWDYGKYGRLADLSQQSVLAFQDELRAKINEEILRIRDKCLLDEATSQHAARFSQDALSQANARKGEIRDSGQQLSDLCCESLKIYREKNTEVRTAPPPAYFSDLSPTNFPEIDLDVQVLEQLVKECSEIAREVSDEAQETIATLDAFIERELNQAITAAFEQARADSRARLDREEAERQSWIERE